MKYFFWCCVSCMARPCLKNCVLICVCTLTSGPASPHGNYIHDSNKNTKKSLNKVFRTQLLNFSEDGRTIYIKRIKYTAPLFSICNKSLQGFNNCKLCLDAGTMLRAWAGLASTTNVSQYCKWLMFCHVSVFDESVWKTWWWASSSSREWNSSYFPCFCVCREWSLIHANNNKIQVKHCTDRLSPVNIGCAMEDKMPCWKAWVIHPSKTGGTEYGGRELLLFSSACFSNSFFSLETMQLILSIPKTVSIENYCYCPRASDLKWTTP